jgi:hypothetical protein
MKLTEEYCWALTQVAGLSRFGQTVSSVLEFGFEPDSVVYTYVVDRMCTQFRLAPVLAERHYCLSRGVSVV